VAENQDPYRESRALILDLVGHADWVWGCAVAPDGSYVVSASKDLKLWDPATGREVCRNPSPGPAAFRRPAPLGIHSWPAATGSVYLLDLLGIEYGPIVVTAVHGDEVPS
jgi:WD40 repeat protein